ncbi:hypothetical protein V1264_024522 [Littorina saxatilis]|uniref:C-type lectin n=2 Tax=Littorina saxatilis TaxID=31220 RepID=A0AAN9AMQ9_9CAEN
MSELMTSKSNLTDAKTQLTEEQIKTQQLLQTLQEKETELNKTQAELAHLLAQAGDEIRTLRSTVGRLTSELNTCKGTLGLATNTSTLPDSSIVPTDVLVSFCDFENHGGSDNNSNCGFRNSTVGFHSGSGKQNSYTGPLEDHTLGSPHGHYMFLDAVKVAASTSSSALKSYTMTTPTYPPGPGYCVRFWYNMYGHDVKDLQVYAKISAGNGYPVFTRTGDQGQKWSLGEADLDREYTGHPFQLVFTATTTAYHHYTSTNMYTAGDVAVDDIYVYNTSCKNIPLCPKGSVTREAGTTTTCYTFHAQPVTWYEAASACRHQGATTSLVTITSKDEQDFIVQTIKNDSSLTGAGQYGFYTAGSDERSEHTFDWTDTGTPYRGTYSNWKEGQPNNVASDQDCLLLQYPDLDFEWGDVDCDERHPFICKAQYPTPKNAASGTPMVG